MTQGILLVGGLGTRLRPLTNDLPKPMLPIAGLPVTEHQLVRARRAGITSLVLATSYLSEVFIPYFEDGSKWGVKLQYAIETEPLGTGGAIRNAAALLNTHESIVIFNGDVLSSHDLSSQIAMHEEFDADVTLHLTHVIDPRAYGCVPIDARGRVTAFLEKMANPIAKTINAGCYVFHPRVIEKIPSGRAVSIEREIFPNLVAEGRPVYGFVDDSYWMDIGTPSALLQGSIDVVRGAADDTALEGILTAHRGDDYVALQGAIIEPGAHILGGSAIGRGAHIWQGARIDGSIICAGATVLPDVRLRKCFVSQGVVVSAGADISDSYIGTDGISLIAGN